MTQEIVTVQDVRGYVDEKNIAWLNAEDVARGLGFTEPKNGIEYVRWRTVNNYLKGFGFSQEVAKGDFIPENMFYLLAMKASNEAAKSFQIKIANEILPMIRKNGVYMTVEAAEKILLNPDFIIKLAQQLKDANEKIAELQPKADYCEQILNSYETLPTTVIAKDYGMGAAKFNQILHSYKMIYRVGKTWVLYSPFSKLGYADTKTVTLNGGYSVTNTQWTQKGRMWIYAELKRHGILPMCERDDLQEKLL